MLVDRRLPLRIISAAEGPVPLLLPVYSRRRRWSSNPDAVHAYAKPTISKNWLR